VDDEGEVRIHKFTSVLDAGHVVNPDGMLAQLQGGLVFGSTAALFGDITVKDGRVQQSNFNDYRILRMSETPVIEIHLIQTDAPPGGIGEPGCTAGPPSLVNAIAAATGVRLRRLPIDRSLLARKSV
jgi:isoquinoline 1-oxidoreductase beta subunit